MRIGMFADMYTPHVSGVTNYVRLYKRELERLGHDVFVLTYGNLDHADDEPNVIRSPGIPFADTGWFVPTPLTPKAHAVIRSLDVMHAHHPYVSGRIVRRYGHALDTPTLFTNHTRYDVYAPIYVGFLPLWLSEGWLRWYLRGFAASLDATIAPSPEIAEWLADWGVTDRALVVRNAIDVDAFANPRTPRSRADLGIAEDAVVVAYLGRVAREKNMPLLVDAFTRAARTDPRLVLLAIGDGPDREASERTLAAAGLADRSRFVGLVPYGEAPDLLAAADFFATASTSETWPLVVMEAAAAGLPTVGVRSPGVGELVVDGATGLLVDEDADAFAAALLRLSSDPGLTARLGQAAFAEAPQHDIRTAAARMAELYERLIAAHRRR